MSTARLEAFSDGVIAIVITIMVLELHTPAAATWSAFAKVLPTFFAYVLSFVTLGIWWNNHHHMLQAVDRVNGKVLWANLHLLFWLTLFPFTTRWMSAHFEAVPAALYGAVALLAAVAWTILSFVLIAEHGPGSRLAQAYGSDTKGKVSGLLYASAIPLAFASPWLSIACFAIVALMWLVPDRRIERLTNPPG